jgi:uncharacterized membrane-anchored protein YjiN (DUF445 family)
MKSRLKELKDNHEFRKGEGWELTTLSEDIDWLIEQAEKIERYEKEVVKLNSLINQSWGKNARCLVKDWKEQQEKIEDYVNALKFYADKENYEEWNEDSDLTEYIHNVDFDGGDNARKALENSQTEK